MIRVHSSVGDLPVVDTIELCYRHKIAAEWVRQSLWNPQTENKALTDEGRSRDIATDISTLILKSLDDDKAQDIVTIDLTGKTAIADAMVIATGRSQRHVGALADHIVRLLKDAGFGRCRVEGMPNADWVLIDAGDVIVHLFRPEVREFYKLEKMWAVDPNTSPAENQPATAH